METLPAREGAQPDRARAAALASAARLRRWLEEVDLVGIDPYDALRSPGLRRLARTPRLRQAAIQTVKRSPLDPRPLLGIRRQANAKGLGIVAAASSKLWALTEEAAWHDLALRAAEAAAGLALGSGQGHAWGYPFDVQVRWAYYPEGTPNAIASVFTAGGLIAAGELLERPDLVERGEAVAPFLDALSTEGDAGRFYAYIRGNRTPVHNANLLVAALRARLSRRRGEDPPLEAGLAVEYSLARQRPDASWPYGEGRGLEWVDGYHTAYVLSALLDLSVITGREDIDDALRSGTRFYLDRLFDAEGAALTAPGQRYPLDAHTVATGLATLAKLSPRNADAAELAPRALLVALERLQTDEGWFMYQRGRFLPNRIAYLRWSNAHMLNALAEFVRACDASFSGDRADAVPVP